MPGGKIELPVLQGSVWQEKQSHFSLVVDNSLHPLEIIKWLHLERTEHRNRTLSTSVDTKFQDSGLRILSTSDWLPQISIKHGTLCKTNRQNKQTKNRSSLGTLTANEIIFIPTLHKCGLYKHKSNCNLFRLKTLMHPMVIYKLDTSKSGSYKISISNINSTWQPMLLNWNQITSPRANVNTYDLPGLRPTEHVTLILRKVSWDSVFFGSSSNFLHNLTFLPLPVTTTVLMAFPSCYFIITP